jgi:hypothetical protein
VITSKSKLLGCMEFLLGWGTKGRSICGGFRFEC